MAQVSTGRQKGTKVKSRDEMGVSTHIKVGDFVRVEPMAFIRFDKFVIEKQWTGQVVQTTPLCIEFKQGTIKKVPGRRYLSCTSLELPQPSQSIVSEVSDTCRVPIIMGETDLVKIKRPKTEGE